MKIFHVKENLDKEDERNTTVPDIQNRAFNQDQVKKAILKNYVIMPCTFYWYPFSTICLVLNMPLHFSFSKPVDSAVFTVKPTLLV